MLYVMVEPNFFQRLTLAALEHTYGRIATRYPLLQYRCVVLFNRRSSTACLQYEGMWYRGEQKGEGTYYYSNGEIFKGSWVGGKKHGKGILTAGNTSFEETWSDGVRTERKETRFHPPRLLVTKKPEEAPQDRTDHAKLVEEVPDAVFVASCTSELIVSATTDRSPQIAIGNHANIGRKQCACCDYNRCYFFRRQVQSLLREVYQLCFRWLWTHVFMHGLLGATAVLSDMPSGDPTSNSHIQGVVSCASRHVFLERF